MTTHSATETNTYDYLKDHLGSVIAITDENADIVEQYGYDAWGRVSVYDGDGMPLTESAIGNRYAFQGREYSWKTGLYYFRARWYDPIVGRWLSKDPIGISGGLNLYAFVGNNPVNYIDPVGLEEVSQPSQEPWYERVWSWWDDLVDPQWGYWNLQFNIPLLPGSLIGPSVSVMATGDGIMFGGGVWLGSPGASFTRGPVQQPVPGTLNLSGQAGFGLGIEYGQTYSRPTNQQQMQGQIVGNRLGDFGEGGAATPGASINFMYTHQPERVP